MDNSFFSYGFVSANEPQTDNAEDVSAKENGKSDNTAAERDNESADESVVKIPEIIFECDGVVKRYGDATALNGVGFEIPEGKIIGLLGPNGAGKTTLIKLIAGLLTLDSGEIRVLGDKIGAETKSVVAYLPERCSLPDYFTVKDSVDFFADFFADFDRKRADEMLSSLQLKGKQRIKALSKGMKEKLQLSLVMSRRARLYLLDEPISGVDPAAREYIIDTVMRNYDKSSSVLISTHLISDIEKIMDGFVFLKEGKIHSIGTPDLIMSSFGKTVDEYFREVFKC